MTRNQRIFIAAVLQLGVVVGTACVVRYFGRPWVCRTFDGNSETFGSYAAAIESGDVSGDGWSFPISKELSNLGVNYIHPDGKCIVFSFRLSGPWDTNKSLIYYPRGYVKFPMEFTSVNFGDLRRVEQINPDWSYWERD